MIMIHDDGFNPCHSKQDKRDYQKSDYDDGREDDEKVIPEMILTVTTTKSMQLS